MITIIILIFYFITLILSDILIATIVNVPLKIIRNKVICLVYLKNIYYEHVMRFSIIILCDFLSYFKHPIVVINELKNATVRALIRALSNFLTIIY